MYRTPPTDSGAPTFTKTAGSAIIRGMPDTRTDEQLANAARDGDADALTELLRRHGPTVEPALRISEQWRPVLDPADVMQITYLEAFLQIGHFDPQRGTPFRAWLQRIAENNLRDAIRGLERAKRPQPRDRIQPKTKDESMVGLLSEISSGGPTPSVVIRREEALKMLSTAISSLPDNYAEVIQLYDLDGLPIDQVAARLGRSAGAVHMLRARAHDRLREALGSATGLA